MERHKMHTRVTLIVILALAVVLLARPTPARAAACQWTGSVSTDWADAGNWTSCGGGTPGSGDTATIPSGGNQPVIGSSTSVTVSGLTINSGASLVVDGSLSPGNLSGAGSMTVNGSLNWSSGTWSGTGATTITASGDLTISSAGAKTLDGRTITNNGTAGVTSGFNFQNDAVFDNQATFDIQASADVDFGDMGGADPSFNNAGTVLKSTASSKATFLFAFNNTGGTIDVQEGGISLNGGGAHTGGTFTVAGGRYLNFYGGTHTVSGSYSGSGAGVPQLSGGALLWVDAAGATFDFDVGGFQWGWGTISGGTLTNDGLFKIAGGSYSKYLDAGTITNNGTVNVTATGAIYFQNSAVFNNQAGATFDIQTDVTLDHGGGAATSFNNAGTVRKSAGAGTATFELPFNNTGSAIDVQEGGISLNGGGTHTGGTFTVAGGRYLNFYGGTHTVSGSYSGSGAGTPQLSGGALLWVGGGGATFDFDVGGFQWGWGTISGGTLTNDGLFKIASSYAKTLDAGTLTNNDTVNVTGTGWFYFQNGAVFNNQAGATFDIQVDATLDLNVGSASFNNAGTLTRSAGSGTATIDVALNNSGAVNVQSGILVLSRGSTHSGVSTWNVSAGQTLELYGGTHTNTGTISVTGTGTVRFSNGAVFNNQTGATFDIQADATLEHYSGSTNFSNAGTLIRSTSGGTATIEVALNNSGTVEVQSGTLAFGGDLTNNSGGVVEIDQGAALTVDGTLTNNGTLRQTLAVDGSGAVEFLHLTNSGGGIDKYRGVIVNTLGNMGDTTVSIQGNQTCNTDGGWSNTVKRCYEIAPVTSQTASVTFYYLDSEANGNAAPDVYHWNGSSWDWQTFDARDTSGDPNWVHASGISSYSPFTLSDDQPTAVTLAGFWVEARGNALVIHWETATEVDTLGFHLYRSDTGETGSFVRLNEELIPSQSPGSPLGASYEWTDANGVAGRTYFYLLDALDIQGQITPYGPVQGSLPAVDRHRIHLPLVLRSSPAP